MMQIRRMRRLDPWLLLYVAVLVLPLLFGLGYSLAYSFGMIGLLSEGFSLGAWQRLFEGDAADAFLYTLALTFWSLVLALVFAYAASWAMLIRPGAGRLYPWLFVPLTLAPVVAAFAVFAWLNPAGLLSRLTFALGVHDGVQDFPRLVQDAGSIGILVVHTLLVGPVLAIVFRQQANAERMPALRKTARSLGASDAVVFFRVFVPAIWRRSGAFVLLYGVYLFGTYEVPLLLGRSQPRVLTVYITDQMTRFDLGNLPLAHAAASAYALAVMILLLRLLTRWNRRLLQP